jgi:hypothetical protein
MSEQFWCHLIDALVGTLGTEYHCHQQLKHAAKLQFGSDLRHLRFEMRQNSLESFFFSHSVAKLQKNKRKAKRKQVFPFFCCFMINFHYFCNQKQSE